MSFAPLLTDGDISNAQIVGNWGIDRFSGNLVFKFERNATAPTEVGVVGLFSDGSAPRAVSLPSVSGASPLSPRDGPTFPAIS